MPISELGVMLGHGAHKKGMVKYRLTQSTWPYCLDGMVISLRVLPLVLIDRKELCTSLYVEAVGLQ